MNNNFEIIPAIDILDGKCVRLTQGKYDNVEEFSLDPVEVARKWQSLGAKRLHLVDLDGAKNGFPQNIKVILSIAEALNIDIEVGGGIRTLESIQKYLDNGIKYVVVGTKAFTDKDFFQQALEQYGKKIILGLDLKNGNIGLSGWNEEIKADFNKMKNDFSLVDQIIFTDITKDGTLTGPNLSIVDEVAKAFKSKIIVSGGLSKLDDIVSLLELKKKNNNLSGVILGKSLYKGSIDLRSAIELVR